MPTPCVYSPALIRELEPRLVASGNEWRTHEALGKILFPLGRYAEALPHAQAYLRHFEPRSYRGPAFIALIGFIIGGLGDPRTAVKLVTAGKRAHEEQGLDVEPTDRRDLNRFQADAREELGVATYEAAVRAANALSIDEAAELALGWPSTDESQAIEDRQTASH